MRLADAENRWGYWGKEPPCEHLLALRDYLRQKQLEISSERGENPDGWVNIDCNRCHRCYETILREPYQQDDDDDDEDED